MINPATGRERELQNPVAPNSMGRIRNFMGKRGISGYDPNYPDMRGVFMAHGPGISLFYSKSVKNTIIFFSCTSNL